MSEKSDRVTKKRSHSMHGCDHSQRSEQDEKKDGDGCPQIKCGLSFTSPENKDMKEKKE